MIDIIGFGHINIVVDSIETATTYYRHLLDAKPIQYFSHFKNSGFAKSAGFLTNPDEVDVSINFLKIPHTDIYLELMCYHNPKGNTEIITFSPNDLGGVRHLCLRVRNIQQAFNKIKQFGDAKILNASPDYRPYKLDKVVSDQFVFFDEDMDRDQQAKVQSAKVSSEISFFYFTDRYGVLWELEEVPEFLDDPALQV